MNSSKSRFDNPMQNAISFDPTNPALPHGTETILLVDDDENILDSITQILSILGYHVLRTTSPERALQMASDNKSSIRLLLTDVIMRGMDGPSLVAKILQIIPGLPVIYMSGYTSDVRFEHGIQSNDILLDKPFTHDCLSRTIRQVLDSSALPPPG